MTIKNPDALTPSRNYREYTTDGTYWTGRKTADGGIEVLRLRAGTYEIVESFDTFQRLGAAVGAAAQLAYLQGWKDAQAELSQKVLGSLAEVGIRPVTIIRDEEDPAESTSV